MEIKIRNANESDNNFIYATWLRGLYHGSEFYGSIEKEAFFKNYQNVVKGLLLKKAVKVSVACLEDTPDIILGYIVFESKGPLHWLYVKESWRKQGVATRLANLSSFSSYVTHITHLGNSIRIKKGWDFNPWLI